MKREWEEDAQIRDSNVGADMEVVAPESTQHVTKSEHINIFFPSLGEVVLCLLSFHFEMMQFMVVHWILKHEILFTGEVFAN